MDFRKLQSALVWLARVEPSEAPCVSCYADVEVARRPEALAEQARRLSRGLTRSERGRFDEAFAQVAAYLRDGLQPATKGIAAFARVGKRCFFVPLQFRVPLPTRISVSSHPELFPLVELQDNYYRYLLVLASGTWVRVFEVELGSATDGARSLRPEPRQRDGREWTRERHREHRRALTVRFLNEQIRLVTRKALAGRYRYVVLAGNARVTAWLLKRLPKSLAASVAGTIAAPSRGGVAETIEASVLAFMKEEERESLRMADRLRGALGDPGRTAVGTMGSLRALQAGRAATLVLSRWYQPFRGWSCGTCGRRELPAGRPAYCGTCGTSNLRELDSREEMIRLAVRSGCPVEIVNHPGAIKDLGGVGCLLRFPAPAEGRRAA